MPFKTVARTAPAVALGVLFALGPSVPAGATLIGDTVTVETEFGFPVTTTSDDVLVGAGVEFTLGDGSDLGDNFLFDTGDQVDIQGERVEITFAVASVPFAFILTISDLDWVGAPGTLTGVTLDDPGNLVASGFSLQILGPDSFEFQATVEDAGTFGIDLEAEHTTTPPPAVSEPDAAWMVLSGMAILGALGLRRRGHARTGAAA